MYFVNQKNHVIESIDLDQTDVDNSIACYKTKKELQASYPTISDSMIPEIPILCPVENENGDIDYFLNSSLLTHELVALCFYEPIDHWIQNQEETFSVTDGVCF